MFVNLVLLYQRYEFAFDAGLSRTTGHSAPAHTSIEVELAISHSERLIADSEGKADVTESSTLHFAICAVAISPEPATRTNMT